MRNVLIVDDERNISEGLASNIDWSRFLVNEVFIANNGYAALEIIHKNPISLVITDIKMPAINGLEFIERAKLLNPDLAFIVLSGYSEFTYVQQAMRMNVLDYLLKPVVLHDLIHLLEKNFGTQADSDQGFNMIPKTQETQPQDEYSPLIKYCIAYIEGHYTQDITLQSIAEVLERNPSYLSYLFKKETGVKLFEYINRVRIKHAQILINTTNLNCSEIAAQVGFDVYRSFVRTYQRITGKNPSSRC